MPRLICVRCVQRNTELAGNTNKLLWFAYVNSHAPMPPGLHVANQVAARAVRWKRGIADAGTKHGVQSGLLRKGAKPAAGSVDAALPTLTAGREQ